MSKNEVNSWFYLILAVGVLIAGGVTGRHDLDTDGLILIAIGVIYSTADKRHE